METSGPDCNQNGVADECDIAFGTSVDADADGVPDDCGKLYFSTTNRADDPCDPKDGCDCTIPGAERLQRVNSDGSNWEPVVSLLSGSITPTPTIDRTGEKIYWALFDEIHRANLDGTEVETIIIGEPEDIGQLNTGDIDPIRGKLYFAWKDEINGTGRIQRANLDGSNVEDLVFLAPDRTPRVAVDPMAGKIYWADGTVDRIQRANLDGSNVQDVFISPTLQLSVTIAIDPCDEWIYFWDNSLIKRVKFDSSSVEILFDPGGYVSFTVDEQHRFFYWALDCDENIYRVSLDAPTMDVTTVIIGVGDIRGFAVDPVGGIATPTAWRTAAKHAAATQWIATSMKFPMNANLPKTATPTACRTSVTLPSDPASTAT